jgi:hypothetical protein
MIPPTLQAIEREAAELLKTRLLAAYQAGWADARAAILSAANMQGLSGASDEPPYDITLRHSVGKRAPKGLLTSVLSQALRDNPGATAQELEQRLPSYDARVSPKSVGNELRRGENERYRRSGGLWYLIEGTD